MSLLKKNYIISIYLLFTLFWCLNAFPQIPGKTIIKGSVTDAKTGEPVSFASVSLKGTTVGTNTDAEGKYFIETSVPVSKIEFSFIGYQTESADVSQGIVQIFDIRLSLSIIALDEVRIVPQRQNYKNKGNPAVELIEKVIEKKDENRMEVYNYLVYKQYEKIQFALSNIKEKFIQANTHGKFSFLFENLDTTKRIGNTILPVYIKESLSDRYFRKNPENTKNIIRAEKTINLDEYLDNKGITAHLNYLYQNINIYENEILFLTNKFLSPISNTSPLFYRYYILDTLSVDDIKCIRLFFEPRNKSDFLFHGNLYITMDSSYSVRKVDMGINKNINIDWVQDISITQDFDKFDLDSWFLSKEEISIDFGVLKNSLGLYGQRSISYKDYKINEPVADEIFEGPEKIVTMDTSGNNPDFWYTNRHIPLTKSEEGIYTAIDSIRKMPEFKRRMNLIILLTTEFLNLGKIEIGPVSNFYSFNTLEGSRFRFGGRTTPEFSKKITFDAYAAYGLNDKIIKYNSGITYSLTSRTIHQFPVKSVKVSYQYDTKVLGQELQFAQADNLFLSFKRGLDDKFLFNRTLKAEYLNEFDNHFSFRLGYMIKRQSSAGNLYFNSDRYLPSANRISSINIPEVYLNLRLAKNESFYQGKLYRYPFPNKNPVININFTGGSKYLKNDFDYLRVQFKISRRYYISILGYTDISLEAGKLFGKVPFPLLFIHTANQTFSYQKDAYNLMNYLEFVSDQYTSLYVDHSFNGFILNKIPLIKKLKFRELVTCKVLYGSLSNSNNPDFNNDLFKFPTDGMGIPLTYFPENKPYVEGSLGLSNVLRIFRIDLIKRFTYLNHPNISNTGIRIQFRLDI